MGDASRPLGVDDDLIELLWCNGHVVMQSQTHRKLPPRPEKAAAAAAAAVMQEDEAGLWFPFSHADSLDKDIFSDLFCEPVPAVGIKPEYFRDGNNSKASDAHAPSELMPPPKSTMADGGELSDLVQARTTGKAAAAAMEQEGASASSFCGSSNQVQMQQRAAGAGRAQSAGTAAHGSSARLQSAVGSGINANARGGGGSGREATVASSSGRSNGFFGTTTTTTTSTDQPTSASLRSSKRKRLDSRTEDYSESPSEDAESDQSLALERKPPLKLATARRSRAAEVHNLSERRRRDRINEKMKALQELIPHCNKTDKASMLDEAIEYLKTLQMQVQMMWMGSGMAPPAVMFPGMHQYLPPRMPSFMAPHPQPAAAAAAQSLPEHYAHFLGVNHHLQPPSHHHQHYAAQGMGYYPLGAKAVQQSPALPIHHAHAANGATPAPAAAAATNSNTPGNGMHPNRR